MSNQTHQSQASQKLQLGDFLIDMSNPIGKGSTGNVYKGHNTKTLLAVACKAIQMDKINNQVTKYLFEGQKQALSVIKSMNVVRVEQIFQQKDFCYIVMQLCFSGTLNEHIKKYQKLSTIQAITIFKGILNGYLAISQALFIHRDLKPSNIMFRSNKEPVIIDFGYCENMKGKRPLLQYNVGSPSYMAPETYWKNIYSTKSDVWALGVILYEMLTGKCLDEGLSVQEYFKSIMKEGKVLMETKGMAQVCKDLLEGALQVNLEKRASGTKLKYIVDKFLVPQTKHVQGPSQGLKGSQSAGSLNFLQSTTFSYKNPQTKSKSKQKFNFQLKSNNQSSRNSYINPISFTQRQSQPVSQSQIQNRKGTFTQKKLAVFGATNSVQSSEIFPKPQPQLYTQQNFMQRPIVLNQSPQSHFPRYTLTPFNVNPEQPLMFSKLRSLKQVSSFNKFKQATINPKIK